MSSPVRSVLSGSGVELSKDDCFWIKFSDVGDLPFESLVRCGYTAIGINHNKTFLISIKSNFSFFRYLYYVVFSVFCKPILTKISTMFAILCFNTGLFMFLH